MSVRLCVLLWEHVGRGHELVAFEDAVLALLPEHGGGLISRDRVIDRQDDDPFEIQQIEMPSEGALAEYLQDPLRVELARTHDRDAVIARTQLFRLAPRDRRSDGAGE